MKQGDKVKFLNEPGGGTVTGFQSKNIVLVEDAEGFEIPFHINEIVLVEEDNKPQKEITKQPINIDNQPQPKSNTYFDERHEGEKVSFFLAYVPINITELSKTKFEIYLVNDSNYFSSYVLMKSDGQSWSICSKGEIEPNTQIYIDELDKSELNDYSNVCVQAMFYKKDKPYSIKSPCCQTFKIDPLKFFKLHSFKDNDFFETPSLIYTVIEKDVIPNGVSLSKMIESTKLDNKSSAETKDKSSYVTRYENQAKSYFSKSKREKDEIKVVDLHANELLDTTAGMSNSDILGYQLDTFRRILDENKHKKNAKIVFIHGKGEGVLRQAIIQELKYRYKSYLYQDASFREYGYGATQVTIR